MISQEFPRLRNKFWHTQNEYYIPKNENETNQEYKERCLRYGNANKAKGKLAGVPDILILFNGILYKIELKQPNGNLGDAQNALYKIWDEDCPQLPTFVARNLYEVYMYCRWICDQDLKINFPPSFKPFKL